MGDIKVENADPHSSHPLVLDVMAEGETEPTATHVLTFGDFIIVQSLENLVIVSAADWAQRQADAAAEQQKVVAEQHAAPLSAEATAHAEAAPSGKLKRKELEAMTKDELDEVADDYDIDIPSHATKAEMVDAILKGQ